jgi:hypothetical protein
MNTVPAVLAQCINVKHTSRRYSTLPAPALILLCDTGTSDIEHRPTPSLYSRSLEEAGIIPGTVLID